MKRKFEKVLHPFNESRNDARRMKMTHRNSHKNFHTSEKIPHKTLLFCFCSFVPQRQGPFFLVCFEQIIEPMATLPSIPESMDDFSYPELVLLLVLSAVSYNVFGRLTSSFLRPKSAPKEPSMILILATLLFVFGTYHLEFATPFLTGKCPEKEYHNYPSFWVRYLHEHQVPEDRVAHLFIFSLAFVGMVWRPCYFVSWALGLTIASLFTRPLLGIPVPFLESIIISAVGGIVAFYYQGQDGYFFVFSSYTLADLLSHIFLGRNGPAALWVGKHYLGWGLWGQAKLVIGMYNTYFDSSNGTMTLGLAIFAAFCVSQVRAALMGGNSSQSRASPNRKGKKKKGQ